MSKKPESSIGESAVAEPESKQKTNDRKKTVWDTFAGLTVTQVVCEPKPGRPPDIACKTRLVPSAQNIIDHIKAGHTGERGQDGGFMLTIVEGPTWKEWTKLGEAGVELYEIRDEVTDRHLYGNDLHGKRVRQLLKPHNGKFRGAWQAFHGQFLFSVGFEPSDIITNDDNADTE